MKKIIPVKKSSSERKKDLLEFLLCTVPPEPRDNGVVRFESKWFKELKKKTNLDEENEEPSLPHRPPRDSTADTYFPSSFIPSTERVFPGLQFSATNGVVVTL